jgi:hypothetical protein
MGRDTCNNQKRLQRTGFNPRARMGRDIFVLPPCVWSVVSIHAPVWGATVKLMIKQNHALRHMISRTQKYFHFGSGFFTV